jgi:hypothetical protein
MKEPFWVLSIVSLSEYAYEFKTCRFDHNSDVDFALEDNPASVCILQLK